MDTINQLFGVSPKTESNLPDCPPLASGERKMWSGSGNGEGGIRAIGAKRPLHDKRLACYTISPLSEVAGPDFGKFFP